MKNVKLCILKLKSFLCIEMYRFPKTFRALVELFISNMHELLCIVKCDQSHIFDSFQYWECFIIGYRSNTCCILFWVIEIDPIIFTLSILTCYSCGLRMKAHQLTFEWRTIKWNFYQNVLCHSVNDLYLRHKIRTSVYSRTNARRAR